MAPPNVKIKHLIRSTSGSSRFPKLDECAHFHYENVELGPIKVVLCDKQAESNKVPAFLSSSPNKENEVDWFCFLVLVVSNGRKWVVRRSYKDFVFLDTQLHRCVYDRKYSLLCELQNVTQEDLHDAEAEENIRSGLTEYLERFSQLAGSLIACGPVLNWLELDNRGNRLIVTDEVAINTPAVAAAYVVAHYTAQAADEISFDVGDMISVIDMPPPDESTWWRGKRGFEVGFFPSECVEVIGDKVPRGFKLSNASTKPVFRKHGKLIAFFRSFLLSRPSRRKLKQSGILKERVFGCDLGEHLLNTAREIPLVLKCCTEFIEEHGVVDGIYRLSGVSSNIQRLRNAFDEDCATNLGDPTIVQDIHSVASLLKMYFRELPNPLLTYQLYDKFVSAVQSNEDVRLLRIRDVVQQLPPPHYRTLQYLLCHLARVASYGEQTGMTPKNIAIVWAPNLLRSRDVENGGVGALHVVGVQAVLTEYLVRYCDLIFDEKMSSFPNADEDGLALRARPKSLAISTPTKLLSLEEARARALSAHLPLSQQKYIDVGGGPDKLPPKYHTVIELPTGKQGCPKLKKSPSGWKSFFSRGWYSGSTRDKSRPSFRSSRKSSTASLPHTSTQLQEKASASSENPYQRKKLRTVKSAESLIQCSKDSSPTSNEAHKPAGSRRSSPEASMDSSFSYEAGSVLSKSPSLQKHTRSSSHESYFDNSMDMMSDPPVEDEEEEHSLFYYVNEQMQKMQECSPTLWQENHKTYYDSACEPDGHLIHSPPLLDGSSDNSPIRPTNINDNEKVVRKQKLDSVDDFAQAKVQRLSWMENKRCDHHDDVGYQLSPVNDENRLGSDKLIVDERSFWLPRSDQSMFCKLSGNHEEGYKLDPFAFYDCALDKRASCVSSSDNETECGTRTVVERYGNAETILVEVHATQDSSSESEPELSKFLRHFDVGECVVLPNEELIEKIGDDSVSVSNHDHELVQYSAEKHVEPCDIQRPTAADDDDGDDDDASCPVLVEHLDGHDCIRLEDIEVRVPDMVTVLSPHMEKQDIFADTASRANKTTLPLESSGNTEHVQEIVTESPSPKLGGDSWFSSSTTAVDLVEHADKEPDVLEKRSGDSEVFKIKTPPSPVYPKHLRSDLQLPQLKTEHVSLHKKKQFVSMPSPSSPVDEVRKKFEVQSTALEKQSKGASVRSAHSPKDTPSKLSLKQKQLFEVVDNVSNECSGMSKRKSDGITLGKKAENLSSKRHSEPMVSMDAVSPTEKTKTSSRFDSSSSQGLIEAHSQDAKCKPSTPSLFTQLKVRKLQSLQGSAPTTPVKVIDPWSDPILDIQEEYHPLPSYPIFTQISESPIAENDANLICFNEDESGNDKQQLPCVTDSVVEDSSFVNSPLLLTMSEKKSYDLAKSCDGNRLVSESLEENSDNEKLLSSSKIGDSFEDEVVRRERINRIKEERRAQLREKLKTESFRLEAEEKEKVQSKFRLKKDTGRYSLDASAEEKTVKEADSDSASDGMQSTTHGQPCPANKSVCSCSPPSDPKSSSEAPLKCDISNSSNKSDSSQSSVIVKSPSSKSGASTESRTTVFRRSAIPGDIRDRVAMFERSKESKEPCRLGPNGKFPQKQGTPTSLTPSYVR